MYYRILLSLITLFLAVGFGTETIAQDGGTISGTVTDSLSEETLPGVNVMVKGTTTGTSTDTDGNFELTVPSLQDTLVVSFVGYETRNVPINGRTDIDIVIRTQAIAGEELVVVGYGTQEKGSITGSISSVGADDLGKVQGGATVSTTLAGKVSGLSF
ncbi:MAG TPA: carboxypeptidase-like regulatory domain-containing protein, partial [Fodinibius sp.]|nr:carboxypeptidase-like regulatory domain-containing protein [Fodinibius sp.]